MWENLKLPTSVIKAIVKTETAIEISQLISQLEQEILNGTVLDFQLTSNNTALDREEIVVLPSLKLNGQTGHHYISCFATIVPSPGWFIGLSNEDFCADGTFNRSRSIALAGWNSGVFSDQDYKVDSKTEYPKPYPLQLNLGFASKYGDVNITTGDVDFPSKPASDESSCFPQGELVTMSDGRHLAIETLKEGDVLLGGEVFTFSHHDSHARAFVVVLEYREGSHVGRLRATPGHMVYRMWARREDGLDGKELVRAADVERGDMLVGADGKGRMVRRIRREVAKGLYNPHTVSGDLVVGGVLVSCFTETLRPQVASVALLPFRALHELGIRWTGRGLSWLLGGSWNRYFERLISWPRQGGRSGVLI